MQLPIVIDLDNKLKTLGHPIDLDNKLKTLGHPIDLDNKLKTLGHPIAGLSIRGITRYMYFYPPKMVFGTS